MSIAIPRPRATLPKLAVGEHFIYPISGLTIPFGKKNAAGTLIDPANFYDPDEIYSAPTAGAVGGLDLSRGIDYNPGIQFRGFIVLGNQTGSVVMAMLANQSIIRLDNITIADGTGWVQVTGFIFLMILCSANGTTCTGLHPTF